MRRLWGWGMCLLLAACGDCPSVMPVLADYGEGPQAKMRAGDQAFLSLFVPVKSACLDLRVTGPDGVIPATLNESGAALFPTTRPGLYTGSVSLRGEIGGRVYTRSVMALNEPATLEACVTLPRPCARVVDGQGRIACDEMLLDREGHVLTSLDGGVWFGSDDLLFAWHEGILEKFDTSDGGAEITNAQALASRPRLWSVSRAGLALAVDDAGVIWDRELSASRTFSVEPDALALSLFDDGGVLIVRPGKDYACMAGGSCAPLVNDSPKVVAVDRQGVWVQGISGFLTSGISRYESRRGLWYDSSGALTKASSSSIPFRAGRSRTRCGAGRWELEGTRVFGATDGVLWRSSETTTKLWCLP